MRSVILFLLAISVLAVVPAGKVQAAAGVLPIGDFAPGDTLIDFESIAAGEEITTQFSALGATFSGGLFGDNLQGPPYMGSTITADNFNVATIEGYFNPIAVTFSGPITRVGFGAITNDIDDMTIRTYRSGLQTGSFSFGTSLTPSFLGVGDLAGIDRIEFEAFGNSNLAFGIDNFLFDGAPGAVPAPGAILLGTLGAGLVGWLRRRRTI